MGPVAAVISLVAKAAAASTIKGFLIRTALTLAGSALLRALAPKPKAGKAGGPGEAGRGIEQQRQIGANVPRAIALGRCIVAGSEAALWASGDGDDNKTNTRVIVVSDWPCRIVSVWWQGRDLTWSGDLNTGWRDCLQFRAKDGSARLRARWLSGDWEQTADADLIAAARDGAPWTSDDRLRGVAALLIQRTWDPDAFPGGAPDNQQWRIEVADAPVFDWRDPAQSLADVRTWRPSDNAIVLLENALCHLRAPAQFSPGTTDPIVGPGLTWARRPLAKLTAAANICDEVVDGAARYRAGGVIDSTMDGRQIIERFAAACGGGWVSSAAGGWLRPGHVSAPVMEIPASALSATEASTYDPWARPDAAVNTVVAEYPDPNRAWEVLPLPPATDDAWRADDGQPLNETLDLSFVSSRAQAWRLAVRRARALRLDGVREETGPHWLLELEAGDVVTMPDPALPEADDAWWIVESHRLNAAEQGLTVSLRVRRIDASIDAAAPAIGAPAALFATSARSLVAPAVTAVRRVVESGGVRVPELAFRIAATAGQADCLLEVQGPAATSTGFTGTLSRQLVLSRVQDSVLQVAPGWYRWRSAGRDSARAVGPWGTWSNPLQITETWIAGDVSPPIANLIPGSGPNLVAGNTAVSWLGATPEATDWTAVAMSNPALGPAAWSVPARESGVRQTIYSPAFPVVAGNMLSARFSAERSGSWVAGGDLGMGVWFFAADPEAPDRPGDRLATGFLLEAGAWSEGAQGALPTGWREVTKESIGTVPADARFARVSVGHDGAAVPGETALARFQRCLLCYGDHVPQWNDAATPGWMWPTIGGTLTDPNGRIPTVEDVLNAYTPAISGPPQLTVACDWLGVAMPGQLPMLTKIGVRAGATDVSSAFTWSVVATGLTADVNATGLVSITAVTGSTTGQIIVTAVRGPATLTHIIAVSCARNLPPTGTAGGNSTATGPVRPTEPGVSLYPVTPNAGPLSVTVGASGVVNVAYAGTFTTDTAGSHTCFAKIEARAAGGAWAQITDETAATAFASGAVMSGAEPELGETGELEIRGTRASLTPGSVQEVRLFIRAPSGVRLFFPDQFSAGSL